MPYLLSGQSFFDKAEIKDITSYLRLLANPDDDPAFIRAVTTPKRGLVARHWRRWAPMPASGTSPCSKPLSRKVSHTAAAAPLGPLREFCQFINRIESRAQREPVDAVMNDLLAAIGYEAWLLAEEDRKVA